MARLPCILPLGLLFFVTSALAYVPALPSNETNAINGAINKSDTSSLSIGWFPSGSFKTNIAYQIAGPPGESGISQGPLVHFSEENISGTFNSIYPGPAQQWIAFSSCDFNDTKASMTTDIFTLAKNRGATAAVLYSEWTDACLLNSEFINQAERNRIMDIYATESLSTTKVIEGSFKNVNQVSYSDESFPILNGTATVRNGQTFTFLLATLVANNATIDDGSDSLPSAGATTSSTFSSNTAAPTNASAVNNATTENTSGAVLKKSNAECLCFT